MKLVVSDVTLMNAQDVVVFIEEYRRWRGDDLVCDVDRTADIWDGGIVCFHFV